MFAVELDRSIETGWERGAGRRGAIAPTSQSGPIQPVPGRSLNGLAPPGSAPGRSWISRTMKIMSRPIR
jgi:hypothetical protein